MKDITEKKFPEFLIRNLKRKHRINKEFLIKSFSILKEIIDDLPLRIGIIFVSNKRIRKLNKEFLGRDCTTDILSFSFSKNYGELIISVEEAWKNAKKYLHTPDEEILYLIIHGLLHLKGYKDYNKEDYEKMKKKQDQIYRRVMRKIKNEEAK